MALERTSAAAAGLMASIEPGLDHGVVGRANTRERRIVGKRESHARRLHQQLAALSSLMLDIGAKVLSYDWHEEELHQQTRRL